MASSEENSALFPIFILTIMALPLVPYTIIKLCRAASKKTKSIHCQCSECSHSGKYRKSIFKRISNFSTCSNLTLMLLWAIMIILVYYIKHMSHEIQVFEPFSILGLEPGASDSDIKKAYRKLSIIYHPDKNPDPEAHKYFVESISKAYQALTDPVSRENFEKYGHPDGRQGFQMGIALPQFLLNIDGASGGILLIWIVGVCILLPLVIAVIYLSRSSKYTGNYVMHQTLSTYYYFMKPSLAPSKVMDVFIKAAEYMEIPVRRTDSEPLQKLFMLVRSELNLDLKNIKQEQAKFWKQHPALVKTELLVQAQLTRESAALSPSLQGDFRRVLEFAPRLLEELMKMAVIPRTAQGHGWLRPAIGVVELSQCIIQAVPLSARKAAGGSSEGIAPFLQLPHFTEAIVKKIARKKVRTFQDLRDMSLPERSDLLTQVAGFSFSQVQDVETVLEMMPSISLEIRCETEGEEGIQEGDVMTLHSWVTLLGFLDYPFVKRENGDPRAFPGHEEVLWFLNTFADDFRLTELIRFGTEVVLVERVDGKKESWVVESRTRGSDAVEREVFEAILVCSGHYTQPQIAEIPGVEKWPGRQIHSHNYRVPEPFRDQIVVLIGHGPSALDISGDIAKVAKEVYIASRAADVNISKLENYDNIWCKRMIERVYDDGTVTFQDGSSVYADTIFYCTGYKHHYPFLETDGIVTVDDNRVGPLYKHVFPPRLAPWLSFIGIPSRETPSMTFELQSKWVARVLSGKVLLPTEEEMMVSVEEYYQEMVEAGMPKHYTHELPLIETKYKNCLLAEIGLPPLEEWREKLHEDTIKFIKSVQSGSSDQWDDDYWDAVIKSKYVDLLANGSQGAAGQETGS